MLLRRNFKIKPLFAYLFKQDLTLPITKESPVYVKYAFMYFLLSVKLLESYGQYASYS